MKKEEVMRIDEAIEIIQKDIDNEDVDWNTPLGEAYMLSFEAAKRLKNRRDTNTGLLSASTWEKRLLPGETE